MKQEVEGRKGLGMIAKTDKTDRLFSISLTDWVDFK